LVCTTIIVIPATESLLIFEQPHFLFHNLLGAATMIFLEFSLINTFPTYRSKFLSKVYKALYIFVSACFSLSPSLEFPVLVLLSCFHVINGQCCLTSEPLYSIFVLPVLLFSNQWVVPHPSKSKWNSNIVREACFVP
jgi:hypothetical protein